jgi:hypothetical protein
MNNKLKSSIEILKRELQFVESRIVLIRKGEVNESKGLSLIEALKRKDDYSKAITILEKNIDK